jgi:hypothetical protein
MSRLSRIVGSMMSMLLLTSCLETVAPTPASTIVSITSRSEAASITKIQNATRFQMVFHLVNISDTTIYVGLSYEVEKLVNQKWQLAYSRQIPWGAGSSELRANRGQDRLVTVDYSPGISEPSVPLEHMRGLYRARLTFSYSVGGLSRLPANEEYTPPFAVID